MQPPLHRRVLWRCAWLLLRFTLIPLMRVRVTGHERIPESGGALLVANHTTFMDFMLCIWGVRRLVHAIGSEQVFRMPVAAALLKQLNAMPISKGKKDKAAVMHLVRAYEAGGIMGMFPEGKRSWTGHPLPITPGTARLVKRLGCPVIYCRVTTGFMVHPRWARWPRCVPWLMSYSAPQTFAEDASVEEILEAMAAGLAIDPDAIPIPPRSFGFRLAEGLPSYLWACPACFADEGLEVPGADRDCVACRACARRWRVDLAGRLHPQTPDTPALTVASARARLSERFTGPFDATRFARDGVALDAPVARLSRIQRGERDPIPLVDGRASLTAEALEIRGAKGELLHRLPYVDVRAVLLQFRDALHFRVDGANFQLDCEGQSTHKWHHFAMNMTRAAGVEVRS
ncbi:MAG: 1-acyl-sn-glycerol-3-phosphate acyltransferase [Alphaproteobacteria bacterium]|nr:1-acyl-sn-glycerol-3-phosphate acyltransferase [Alphaproteobacteria bacterium]